MSRDLPAAATTRSDETVEILRQLLRLYEDRGLISPTRRLSQACVHCGTCWPPERGTEIPKDENLDVISLPWNGERYDKRRIVVVGMNFDQSGGWGAHWDICTDHQKRMRKGDPGKDGRAFALTAMRYVAALDGGSGSVGLLQLSPQSLAPRWDDVALPYPEMFVKCPPTYLADELEILKPRALLVLGRSRLRDVVRPMLRERFGLTWGSHPPGLEADGMMLAGAAVDVVCVNHPSSRPADVHRSLDALMRLAPLSRA